MAVAFVSSSTAANQTGSTFSVTKPSSAADGNWLVAFQATSLGGGSAPTAPSGWSLLDRQTFAISYDIVCWIKLVSGDGASYTFNNASGGGMPSSNVYILCWSGADTPTQITKNSGSGFTFTALGITTTIANTYLAAAFGINSNVGATWSLESPLTDLGGIGDASARMDVGYLLRDTTGASGNKTAATGNSQGWGSLYVAIPPTASTATSSTGTLMGI